MKNSPLYRKRAYPTKNSRTVLFYLCPFGTKFWAVRINIKKLQRAGYNVVVYDTTNDVFYGADPSILIDIIDAIAKDIKDEIKTFQNDGINDFGFFSTSLGSFIAYNCVSRIPQLRWGVFNTGGNIADALFRIKKSRQSHEKKGVTLRQVTEAWHHLQYPNFQNLHGHSYIFFSSRADRIAPFEGINEFVTIMQQAGAHTELIETRAFGHVSAAVRGFQQSNRLLRRVRATTKS